MDKVAADERRRQWINYSSTTECGGAGKVCGRAACFPCGAYARTSARLRLALNGRDATDIDSKQALSADCWQFALCFPCAFPGRLLQKLTSTLTCYQLSLWVPHRQVADHCPLILRHRWQRCSRLGRRILLPMLYAFSERGGDCPPREAKPKAQEPA
jgi:hypothetical protein